MRPVRRKDGPQVLEQENVFQLKLLTLYCRLGCLRIFELFVTDLSVRARALELLLCLRLRDAVLAVYA
jgi:hypothetical protein